MCGWPQGSSSQLCDGHTRLPLSALPRLKNIHMVAQHKPKVRRVNAAWLPFEYIHSLIDGHLHVSSAGDSVMKLLERYLLSFFSHLAVSPHGGRDEVEEVAAESTGNTLKMKSALSIKSVYETWDQINRSRLRAIVFVVLRGRASSSALIGRWRCSSASVGTLFEPVGNMKQKWFSLKVHGPV